MRAAAVWRGVAVACGAQAVAGSLAELNEALEGVKFGDDPGPCPTESDACTADVANMPDYIKDIEVIGRGTIGSTVTAGFVEIWDLEFGDISMDSLQVSEGSISSVSGSREKLRVDAGVEGLRMEAFGRARFTNLELFNIFTLSGTANVRLSLDDMQEDDDSILVDLAGEFFSDEGFSQSPPNQFEFLEEDAGCRVRLGNGISLENVEFENFFLDIFAGAVDFILLTLLKGLIEGVMCRVITQLDTLETGEPGLINILLDEVLAEVDALKEQGVRDREDFEAVESFIAEDSQVLDFSTDENFVVVSKMVNQVLGQESDNPDYAGRPGVDEVVDLLIGDKSGILVVDDVKETFQLQEYPSLDFTSVMANGKITLEGFRVEGLNTFNVFQVLDNGFNDREAFGDPYRHTLIHELGLNFIEPQATIQLTLEPGEWVSPEGDQKVVSFTFGVGLRLENPILSLATLSMLMVDPILDLQVAQLTSPACLAKGLQRFELLGFKASTTNLGDLTLVNFFGLQELMEDIIRVTNTIIKPTLEFELPAITENLLRPLLNEFLLEFLASETDGLCQTYSPELDDNQPISLVDSTLFGGFEAVMNRVVGGEPVKTNPADINTLVTFGLEYLVFDRASSTLADEINHPAPGTWQLKRGVGWSVTGNQASTQLTISGPSLVNLDSIWALGAALSDESAVSFTFALGDGALINANDVLEQQGSLGFRLPLAMSSVIDGEAYANDDFAIGVDLGLNFTGTFVADVLAQDVLGTELRKFIEYPACILALFREQELSDFDIFLRSFQVFTENTQPFSDTVLGNAFKQWNLELSTAPVVASTRALINSMLSVASKQVKQLVEDGFEPSYSLSTCVSASDPFEDFVFSFPSLEAINETLVKGTTEQFVPDGDLASDWEDLVVDPNDVEVFRLTEEANGYVELVSSVLSPDTVRSMLVQFANTTASPENENSAFYELYRILELAEDDSVSARFGLGTLLGLEDYLPTEEEALFPGLSFEFGDILVSNIDQLSSVRLLEPYVSDLGVPARFSTRHALVYNKPLEVSVGIRMTVSSEVFGDDASTAELLTEVLNVTVGLEQTSLDIITALAVNQTTLSDVRLGQVFSFDAGTQSFSVSDVGLACLRELVYANGVQLPMFQAAVSSVVGPTIDSLGTVLNESTRDVFVAFVTMIVATFREHIPNFTQGVVRELLIEMINELIVPQGVECQAYQGPSSFDEPRILDLVPISSSVASFVESDLLNPSSTFFINSLLPQLFSALAGSPFSVDLPELVYNEISLGGFVFTFGPASINGLGDTGEVTELAIMDTQPYTESENAQTSAQTRVSFSGEVTFKILMSYEIDGLFVGPVGEEPVEGGYPVRNDLELEISLESLSIALGLLTSINVDDLLGLYAGNILEIYNTPETVSCLLAMFSPGGLQVLDFDSKISKITLGLKCNGVCSSPMLTLLEDGSSFETDEVASADLIALFEQALAGTPDLIAGETILEYVDDLITTAKKECRGISFDFDIPEEEADPSVAGTMALLAVSAYGVFFIIVAPVLYRKNSRGKKHLLDGAISLQDRTSQSSEPDAPVSELVVLGSLAMHKHPAVSKRSRVLIPISLLVVTVCFLMANFFTNGTTVQIKFAALGDQSMDIDILNFNLESSINDMWGAKAYTLAFIIFFASGFWPHTKTFLLLFSWYAPATILGAKRRGTLLHYLDALGKWSLIDAFVLFILQVSFRFLITSSSIEGLGFLPKDMVAVEVTVVPRPSIYFFIIATSLALISSHFMILMNRNMLEYNRQLEDKLYPTKVSRVLPKASLNKYVFSTPDEKGQVFAFKPQIGLNIFILNGICCALILVGIFLPIMRFEYRGLAGFAIGAIESDLLVRVHSAASIAATLTEGIVGLANEIGVRFLQLTFVMFTFGTPILLCIIIVCIFHMKMTVRDQKRFLFMAEVVAAWDATLVFFVSLVAALLQLSQLAQFIVKEATGTYCSALEEPLLAIGVNEVDAKCFDVLADIESTSIVFILGSFLTLGNLFYSLPLMRAAIQDRDHVSKGRALRLGVAPSQVSRTLRNAVFVSAQVEPPATRVKVHKATKSKEVANPLFLQKEYERLTSTRVSEQSSLPKSYGPQTTFYDSDSDIEV